MSNNTYLWWEEEIKYKYQLLVYFSYGFVTVSSISRLPFIIFSPLSIWREFLKRIIHHFLAVIFLKFFERKSPNMKAISGIIAIEYYHLLLFLSSWNINPYILELFSFSLTIKLELPFVQNRAIANLILLKHFYVWCFHGIISGDNSISLDMSFFRSFLTIFIICNIGEFYLDKVSYEKFNFSKELEVSKKRLKIITDAFPDGISIISRNRTIEFFNGNIISLLNCESSDLYYEISRYEYCPNRKVSSLSSSNLLIDDISEAFDYLENDEITLGITFLNNVYLEWKIKKITWEDAPMLFLTVRNVNQIIELEKSIATDNMKTVLLRSVSHELRTPLNSIEYFIKEISENSKFQRTEEEKKNLKIVSVSSKLMLSLIDDLLDYSKILAGVFTVKKTQCEPIHIIKNCCELVSMQVAKKNLVLICRLDPNIPSLVITDPIRLSQILLNLLSNALKFTLKGSIEICCTYTLKSKLKISVEDTGMGMTEEIRQRLFTEFSTSYIPSINPRGSGLGLCISNFLAKQLGGKPIKVKSIPEIGSTFWFSIDVFHENSSVPRCEKLFQVENEGKIPFDMKKYESLKNSGLSDILIVDDNEFNRIVLSAIIEQQGWSIEEACNGKDALNKVIACNKRNHMYKVIVMDCSMPEMSGFEATMEIVNYYKNGKISKMPSIIGYSAFNTDEDKNVCFECGMIDYLTKPCPPEKITSAIKKYL
ncbi:unnamed protein product [Blepharisma stoltei]|uniref:Histidine kinase n=1 Tax=Blepharisma stoltei TaxID=1481888 RepID=A0AAU9IME7_9CILI|nr:unnamed protein product [Blepharisma stoltei]